MIYRCNRCPDHTEIHDVAGCVAHAAEVHRSSHLRFEDFTALGGGRDPQRAAVRESRTPPPGAPDQLELDLTLETS